MPTSPGRANATLTAVDQVLSSASNALMILALAHVSSISQFGVAALLMAVITMCWGFTRGAIGTVLLLLSNHSMSDIRSEAGYASTSSFGFLVVAAIPVLICSVALGEFWLGVAFAVCAPLIALQDTLRITSLAMGNALAAVISDGLRTVGVLALFVVNSIGIWKSPEGTVYLWGLGGLVGWLVLVSTTGVMPKVHRVFEWWGFYWRSRLRFGLNYSLDQVGAVIMTAIATALVGTAAAAALRGAYTLFGPLAIVITSFMLIFVPQTRRAESLGTQWRRMLATSGIMALFGIGTAAVLLAIPDSIGKLILGDIWQPAMTVVPYMGISCVAVAVLVATHSMMAAQGLSRMLLSLHIVQVVLILIFTAAGAVISHAAVGIAAGEAAAGWVSAVMCLIIVNRLVKRLSAESEAPNEEIEKNAALTRVEP